MKQLDTKEKFARYMMPVYNPFDVTLVRGNQATLFDDEGEAYIDCTSGIGVNALGHNDLEWSNAIVNQAHILAHTSNLYYNQPSTDLAEILVEATGMDGVFFANSGAEANECAIKVARKASYDKYGEGRYEIISLIQSFHGRTMATLTATGQAPMHPPFAPMIPGFRYVPAEDIAALENAIGPATCAVMLEVVQGEGGVRILDANYLKKVESLCRAYDLTLIVDEVQTGIGRTGHFLASEHAGIKPDIITLAKGLGGGLPIGACLVKKSFKQAMTAGTHGSTFGGNPICCSGAKVVCKRINNADFLAEVSKKGAYMKKLLEAIEGVEKVDQLGLMIGITLKEKKAIDVLKSCLTKGLLVLTAKEKVRLLPPLIISYDELKEAAEILKGAIEA